MKWPQRNSQAAPHQRWSSQIGRTLVESVDHDHDHNHWFIHHRLCAHPTHNVHPYPHRGTARPYRFYDHNHLFLSHPSTIDRRRQKTIHAPTLQPGDVHELQHTKFLQFVPLPYRLHNRLRVTLQAPQGARSPHLPVAEEIPSLPRKGSLTDHRALTLVSTSLRTTSVSVPFKEYTSLEGSILSPLHHNTHLNPQQVPVPLEN